MTDKFIEKTAALLDKEIKSGLPGTPVQWEMASSDRLIKNFPRNPGPDAKTAAVLILLYPLNGCLHTVLMQRPDYNGVHGGQISFPGGKAEPADKTIVETALREAYEETGIRPDRLSVINTLTPLFIPVSNIIVTPVAAWTKEKPVFRHDPGEVVFLFDVNLSHLTYPDAVKITGMTIRGEKLAVRYYDYDGKVIWGATAMMIRELLALMERGNIPLIIS